MTRPIANPDSYRDTKQSIQNGFCCTIPLKSELQVRGPSACQRGPSVIHTDIFPVPDLLHEADLLETIPMDKKSLIQPILKHSYETTSTVGTIPCESVAAVVTRCPHPGPTARNRVFGTARGDTCNFLPAVDAESSGDSDQDLDSDISDSEIECDSENEEFTYNLLWDLSAPTIDLPISREGVSVEDLAVPSAAEFADAQLNDPNLVLLRKWTVEKKLPTTEEIAGFSARVKELAQVANQTQIREEVLILKRAKDPERELIIVPADSVERVIRILHEGVGSAHQAAKATAAKVIKRFFWPGLKQAVRLFVACCSTCDEFFRMARTPKAGLHLMNVGG